VDMKIINRAVHQI